MGVGNLLRHGVGISLHPNKHGRGFCVPLKNHTTFWTISMEGFPGFLEDLSQNGRVVEEDDTQSGSSREKERSRAPLVTVAVFCEGMD
jgi:hypothetical protein